MGTCTNSSPSYYYSSKKTVQVTIAFQQQKQKVQVTIAWLKSNLKMKKAIKRPLKAQLSNHQ